MPFWILFSGILSPAIFWIAYFYFKDRLQPEPFLKIGTAYLLGIFSGLAVLHVARFLPLLGIPEDPSILMESWGLHYLAYSVGVTGLMEELFKFFPFLVIVMNFKDFDEKIDGIIYASMIALGFASYENIRHLVFIDGLEMLGRAFASPLTHTIFSSIWGYTVGAARLARKPIFGTSIIGIGIAAISHGVYNYLTASAMLRAGSAAIILVIWIWRLQLIEKLAGRVK
ncbi:MAG: PrsW family intramembrane metalloprotease [Candidatus Aminicenantes bacterium]|nr:PrsW family intramembrane metalloprotease [Candidatus Aminicenantes bacterium]